MGIDIYTHSTHNHTTHTQHNTRTDASLSSSSSSSSSMQEQEQEDEEEAAAEHGAVNEEEALALAEGAWGQLMKEGGGAVPYEGFTACVETLRGVAHSLLGECKGGGWGGLSTHGTRMIHNVGNLSHTHTHSLSRSPIHLSTYMYTNRRRGRQDAVGGGHGGAVAAAGGTYNFLYFFLHMNNFYFIKNQKNV